MAVVVLPEIDQTLRESQSLLIEVRSEDAHLPAAMAALRQALLRLEGPGCGGDTERVAYVSAPIPLPDAYLILVDFGSLPDEPVLVVPELLARQLGDAGVRDAVVTVARAGPIDAVEGFGTAARAHLRGPLGPPFGDAPPEPPLPLLDVALEWLHAAGDSAEQLSAIVLGVDVPLTPDSIRPVAAGVLSTRPMATTVTLVAGDVTTGLVAATVGSGYHHAVPAASLTAARPHAAPGELVGRMYQLRDLVRGRAGTLLWAGVDAEPDTRRVLFPAWGQRLPADGGPVTQRPDVNQLADELVPDAFWYQVLSAGHLDRLGGLPSGATPLPDGRAELTIGEAEQWLPGHPAAEAVRARGRALLAGCLVSEQEARTMAMGRIRPPAAG